MDNTIKQFCDQAGISLAQFAGEQNIGGSLYLESVTSIPDGFNPKVGGYLDLESVTSIPDGFNPKVGGYLDLRSVTSIPDGFNPTVGGDLYLRSVTSIPDGFNPTVGGDLYLRSVTSIPDGFNPTVGGSLDLRSVTSIPDGFNPTVGGDLYLRSVTSIPDGFNPTVGGDLYLRSVTSIPDGFNPTVGGSLYLESGLTSETKEFDSTQPFEWLDGKYILADGEFTEVVSKKGNIRRVKRINKDKVFYLVTDGEGKFAHGDTLAEAKESLIYKISNRDTSKYKDLTLDSELTFEGGVEMYRIITGACAAGTRHFVESTGTKKKNYTVREIIEMTAGRYGHDRFVEFFNA